MRALVVEAGAPIRQPQTGVEVKVFELMHQIEQMNVALDLPVVVGSHWRHRYQPEHMQVQRVCGDDELRPCDEPRCESAFMALVIS